MAKAHTNRETQASRAAQNKPFESSSHLPHAIPASRRQAHLTMSQAAMDLRQAVKEWKEATFPERG